MEGASYLAFLKQERQRLIGNRLQQNGRVLRPFVRRLLMSDGTLFLTQ